MTTPSSNSGTVSGSTYVPMRHPLPTGLEVLSNLDQLIVRQELQMLEIFTQFKLNNKYCIMAGNQQPVLFAIEHSNFLTTNFFGNQRPFELVIYDRAGSPVIRVVRPFRMAGFSLCGILQEIEVFSSQTNQLLGTVKEEYKICQCQPMFKVLDGSGNLILWIVGDCCTLPCADKDFCLYTRNRSTMVGKIIRYYPGFFMAFTDVDVFGVQFPVDLSVEVKAVVLAATFIIDFMYYEENSNRNGSSMQPGQQPFSF